MSIACKIASFVVLIASIISGIVWGNISYDFSWGIFFAIVISGLLFFLIFFALGEILERLDAANAYMAEVARDVRIIKQRTNDEPEKEKVAPAFKSPYGRPVQSGNTWVCPKCHEKNPQSARFCQHCGEHP